MLKSYICIWTYGPNAAVSKRPNQQILLLVVSRHEPRLKNAKKCFAKQKVFRRKANAFDRTNAEESIDFVI